MRSAIVVAHHNLRLRVLRCRRQRAAPDSSLITVIIILLHCHFVIGAPCVGLLHSCEPTPCLCDFSMSSRDASFHKLHSAFVFELATSRRASLQVACTCSYAVRMRLLQTAQCCSSSAQAPPPNVYLYPLNKLHCSINVAMPHFVHPKSFINTLPAGCSAGRGPSRRWEEVVEEEVLEALAAGARAPAGMVELESVAQTTSIGQPPARRCSVGHRARGGRVGEDSRRPGRGGQQALRQGSRSGSRRR